MGETFPFIANLFSDLASCRHFSCWDRRPCIGMGPTLICSFIVPCAPVLCHKLALLSFMTWLSVATPSLGSGFGYENFRLLPRLGNFLRAWNQKARHPSGFPAYAGFGFIYIWTNPAVSWRGVVPDSVSSCRAYDLLRNPSFTHTSVPQIRCV